MWGDTGEGLTCLDTFGCVYYSDFLRSQTPIRSEYPLQSQFSPDSASPS